MCAALDQQKRPVQEIREFSDKMSCEVTAFFDALRAGRRPTRSLAFSPKITVDPAVQRAFGDALGAAKAQVPPRRNLGGEEQ